MIVSSRCRDSTNMVAPSWVRGLREHSEPAAVVYQTFTILRPNLLARLPTACKPSLARDVRVAVHRGVQQYLKYMPPGAFPGALVIPESDAPHQDACCAWHANPLAGNQSTKP